MKGLAKMELGFDKLNGLGNDFVFIDDLSDEIELSVNDVAKICDRHFGVGADGVILVRPSEREECTAYMHYINSDGSLAQMCGNGVRCFAKYLVDHGFVESGQGCFVADTLSGPKTIHFTTDDEGRLDQATVDMGEPILCPSEVPVSLDGFVRVQGEPDAVVKEAITSPWGDFEFTCVSMGNPHAVCFIDDWSALPDTLFTSPERSLSTFDVPKIGAFFESCAAFPEKSNIEFAQITEGGIEMRVYERGCGETLACGTGACATCVAAVLAEGASHENDVHLLGGTLHIDWTEDNHVLMTGPAQRSFSGVLDTDLL